MTTEQDLSMGLPIIDLDIFLSGSCEAEDVQAECKKAAQALVTYGALLLHDSRVSEDDNITFLDLLEDYFAQPEAELKKDERPELGYQIGVTLENTEKPKCAVDEPCLRIIEKLDPAERPLDITAHSPDPKCRFFWRMSAGPPPYETKFPALNADNIVPEAPHIRDRWPGVMDKWGSSMKNAVEGLSEMTAVGLGLPASTFKESGTYGPHLLAPTASDLSKYGTKDTILAGFHTDLNFLTIHGRSRYPGLHIWARNTGKRIPVKIPPGNYLVVQAGKQLEHITGGLIKAGFHEVVVNEQTVDVIERRKVELPERPLVRISSTFFWHLNSDLDLAPILNLAEESKRARAEQFNLGKDEGEEVVYPPMKVGQLVQNELQHIELMPCPTMVEPNQVSKIWEAAIRQYEDTTGRMLDDPAVRGLTTVDKLRDSIENQNKAFSDFRQKRHGLYAALSAAMGPIELVGGLASEAAATVFPASTYVFAAVQYLIGAANGVSEKYDAIVEVLGALKVKDSLPHHFYVPAAPAHTTNVGLYTVILEILAVSQKEMKRGRFRSFGKSLIGASDEGKVAMEKLSKLFDSEKGIVGAETLSEVKSISVAVDKLNIGVSNIVNSQSAHAAQDQTPLQKIRAILDPSGRPDEMYHAFKRNRLSETGVWIREEPEFKAWMRGENPILWISGNPGAGKSYIATNFITDLVAAYPRTNEDTSSVSVGYFFFKDDNTRTRSFHQGLRDIAYMVSQTDQAYGKHILATCDAEEDISSLYKVWQKLFISYYGYDNTAQPSKRKIFIVLDGLDESSAEERHEFFELARDIKQSSQLQLVMFGRLEVMSDIQQYLDMPDVPTIHVTAENNSQDIRRYIRKTISKSVYLKKSSKLLLNEIISELSKKAQGMFTWVNLMLTDILKMRGEGAIRKALQEAPRGLHEMIRHVLEGYSISLGESPEILLDFNEILMWVAVTARPLKLGDIDSVLKWRSESGESVIGLEQSLRTQFASFFTLARQDGLRTSDLLRLQHGTETSSSGEDGNVSLLDGSEDENWDEAFDEFDSDPLTTEVTFSHASFGDFFHDENEGPVSAGEDTLPVGVDIRRARVHVFRACLDIMSCDLSSPKGPVASEFKSCAGSIWLDLLGRIDISKTSEEDKEVISIGLMSVLTKSPGLADVGWNSQLTSRDTVDLLKLWLESSPAPEVKGWYSLATAENDADIISGVVRQIGKIWLSTDDEGRESWLSNARAVTDFIAFRKDEEPKPSSIPDEETVLKWRVRHSKSWIYLDKRNYETAVKLDLKIYQELLTLHVGHDTKEPDTWEIDLHKVCHRLAICYEHLQKEDEQIEYLEKATSYDMRCYACLMRLIRLLWPRQDFDNITSKLTRLEVQLPDKDYTGLTEALLTGIWTQNLDDYKFIAVAALYSNRLEWLLDSYNTAIQTAKKEHKTAVSVNLELTLAVIFDKGIRQHERGAEIYNRVLDIYGDSRIDENLVLALSNAKIYLANYLISRAVEDGPLSKSGLEYGRQLENLVEKKLRLVVDDNVPSFAERERDMGLYEQNLLKKSVDFSSHHMCYVFLGNYYKLAGRTEDAMRQYAKVVRGCLEILDNDDDADDFAAFGIMVHVVASTIGPEEAVDIFYLSWATMSIFAQLWTKRVDETSTEHEGSDKTFQLHIQPSRNTRRVQSEDDKGEAEKASISPQTLSWTVEDVQCLGCWKNFASGQWEKHYICYHCLYGFCIDCHAKLRTNTYDGPVCSPLHDWFEIPAPSEELMKNWQVGKLFLRGEWVDMDVWKNSLRKRFLEK
ncbi:hypothetical protein V494_01062 [Pseudogymnoascus sp. VKM F-4513 (FW-928)]|nr:hypothetical protein V494_01062 [Pseudogymnoascus sp. VKM F-4513 (FW-928)]